MWAYFSCGAGLSLGRELLMRGLLEGFGTSRGLTWMGGSERPVVIRADIAAAYDDDMFTPPSVGFHTARLSCRLKPSHVSETVGNRRVAR